MSLTANEVKGLRRFAADVRKAFKAVDENMRHILETFKVIALAVDELRERVQELEEHVVDAEERRSGSH